jgi:ABC-type multidrug transport system ATPase subunit
MSAPAIEFHNVNKTYQRRFSSERVAALTDVSFQAQAGEVCAFLGPNGLPTICQALKVGGFAPATP